LKNPQKTKKYTLFEKKVNSTPGRKSISLLNSFVPNIHLPKPKEELMPEEKRFHVIRVSEDYRFVLVVHSITGKPPWDLNESDPERPEDLTYYRCDYRNEVFEPCSERVALQAFSGIADGMGYGELAKESFKNLEEVADWRDGCVVQYLEHLERLLDAVPEDEHE
jgi:hypothetical protein